MTIRVRCVEDSAVHTIKPSFGYIGALEMLLIVDYWFHSRVQSLVSSTIVEYISIGKIHYIKIVTGIITLKLILGLVQSVIWKYVQISQN